MRVEAQSEGVTGKALVGIEMGHRVRVVRGYHLGHYLSPFWIAVELKRRLEANTPVVIPGIEMCLVPGPYHEISGKTKLLRDCGDWYHQDWSVRT